MLVSGSVPVKKKKKLSAASTSQTPKIQPAWYTNSSAEEEKLKVVTSASGRTMATNEPRWLIGILIMVYYNALYNWVVFSIPYITQPTKVFFIAQMIFFQKCSFNGKHMENPPHRTVLFFQCICYLFFRRSRIPGVWGLRITSTRLKKNCLGKYIIYIYRYIWLENLRARTLYPKFANTSICFMLATTKKKSLLVFHPFFQVKKFQFPAE